MRGTSECFGEVAFFAETPSNEAAWTNSVVRILVIPRHAYDQLVITYPNQIRLLMHNLKSQTEKVKRHSTLSYSSLACLV